MCSAKASIIAFLTVARVRVVGRADQQQRGGQIIGGAPLHWLIIRHGVKLLAPDLAQHLHGRQLAYPERRGTVVQVLH
jgi:hypothetical protein